MTASPTRLKRTSRGRKCSGQASDRVWARVRPGAALSQVSEAGSRAPGYYCLVSSLAVVMLQVRPVKICFLIVLALIPGIRAAGKAEAQAKPPAHELQVPAGFNLATGMSLLFGNFNLGTNSSNYDIPQTTVLDLKGSFFEIGDEIIVRPFWISAADEGGMRKIVLLTYAVPARHDQQSTNETADHFDCHACSPLLGAAIFVQIGSTWAVESSRTAVSRAGAWGDPPSDVQIVSIGPHRSGIEITNSDAGQGETTTARWVLVPWNGKVNEAALRLISDDDKGGCGKDAEGFPCYANRKKMTFVAGKNPEYYDILLVLTGTDLTDGKPLRTRSVQGFERLSFEDGIYKTTHRSGDITSAERAIEGRD